MSVTRSTSDTKRCDCYKLPLLTSFCIRHHRHWAILKVARTQEIQINDDMSTPNGVRQYTA
jgi:hypothetical protein